MPPISYVTFVYSNVEIIIGVYATKDRVEKEAIKRLSDIVKNPLDFKIKK